MQTDSANTKRDKIIVEILFNAYPVFKSADDLCSLFSDLHRKSKSIKNAKSMGQILRRFDLVNRLSVIQDTEGYNSICRYQASYKLKEIDFKNLEVYSGKPTDSIMEDVQKN